MSVVAAFALGIAGGAHCFAMCGPIAGAVSCTGCPSGKASWLSGLRASVGRVATYVLLGALAGGFGHVLVSILPGPGFRTALRLFAALTVLIAGLALLGFAWPSAQLERAGAGVFRLVGPKFRAALRKGATSRPWWVGLLWGLIPCGLVYSALALAVDSGSALAGATTLLAFGIATIPAPMLTALLLQGSGSKRTHVYLRRIGGTAAILLALVGIGRELGDFIPFELPGQNRACCTHRPLASIP